MGFFTFWARLKYYLKKKLVFDAHFDSVIRKNTTNPSCLLAYNTVKLTTQMEESGKA